MVAVTSPICLALLATQDHVGVFDLCDLKLCYVNRPYLYDNDIMSTVSWVVARWLTGGTA
jgi:hypothetical protein